MRPRAITTTHPDEPPSYLTRKSTQSRVFRRVSPRQRCGFAALSLWAPPGRLILTTLSAHVCDVERVYASATVGLRSVRSAHSHMLRPVPVS